MRNCAIRILIALLFSTRILYGGNVTDSLKIALSKATSDTAKIKLLIEIAQDACSYNNDEALKYIDRALSMAQKVSPRTFEVNAIIRKALIIQNKGSLEEGLALLLKAYKLANEIHYYKGKLKALNNIGVSYSQTGDRKKATEYYLAAVKIAEGAQDKKSMVSLYVNIGVDFMEAKQYEKAREYMLKSKALSEQMQDYYTIASTCMNLGSIFIEEQQYDSALYYYNTGLANYNKINYREGIALTYYYFGHLQKKQGKTTEALANFKKAYSMIDSLKIDAEKPNLLLNIAEIELNQKQLKEALQHTSIALALAKQYAFTLEVKEAYNLMSEINAAMGNYKEALANQTLFFQLKDSLNGTESNKSFFEMQAKYESEKKQKAIELLNKNKRLQDAEITNQKTQRNGLIGIIVLAVLLVVFSSYGFVKIKKAHKTVLAQKAEIETKNEALNKKNAEIVAQRDEIQNKNEALAQQNEEIAAQRDEIESQKHLIEEKQKEVIDSINYAKKIQQTILPSQEEIRLAFPESFVVYQPKDIVAGDFYWMHSLRMQSGDRKFLMATADCTGHGVPGAFMSMLGMSFLNEIVIEAKITQPDLILNKLRDNVIKAISSQKFQDQEELKDGMDMTMICFDPETLLMEMAAANNSLYILRPSGGKGLVCNRRQLMPVSTNAGGALYEIKANKFPIGKQNEIPEPFTLNTIQLAKGDLLYMYTDGYADQFGGPLGKKFKYKQFEELLLTNSIAPLNKQSETINQKLNEWKGNLEQVDDITIVGIKIV